MKNASKDKKPKSKSKGLLPGDYDSEKRECIPNIPFTEALPRAGHYTGKRHGCDVRIENGEARYYIAPIDSDPIIQALNQKQALYDLLREVQHNLQDQLTMVQSRISCWLTRVRDDYGIPEDLQFSAIHSDEGRIYLKINRNKQEEAALKVKEE